MCGPCSHRTSPAILLDTCTLICDALAPDRLSPAASNALTRGESEGSLACADITLWEIAMLLNKDRLDPSTDSATFCQLALGAHGVRVLPVTPEYDGVPAYKPCGE